MTTEEKELLHDLVDDLEQALYTKNYEQAKKFKKEIQTILEQY